MGAVEAKMPRRVKRKRPIVLDDGSRPGGMEEYYDYIFPVGAGGCLLLLCLCDWERWGMQFLSVGEGAEAGRSAVTAFPAWISWTTAVPKAAAV